MTEAEHAPEPIDLDDASLPDPAGLVNEPSLDFPTGYRYGVTRYADLILRHAFPQRFSDLVHVLEHFTIQAEEILSGGGGRATHTARFDASLESLGWGKRNITIEKRLGGSLRTLQPGRSQVNMIESRKREHSRKPDEQYPLIEACSPGPYLELFARYAQPGWSAWGNEASEESVPRGRTHSGYRGGPIDVPHLKRHMRVEPHAAEILGSELRRRYEAGSSIRDIALETGYSIARVRTLLESSNTVLRRRGRSVNS